jgi:aryl-alcohol dehydrogenase-like predicted oxidoreductase
MANQTVIKLQDGNVMPQRLGVWKAGNDEVVSAIHKALEVGYRSIDTAAAYKNEDGVGAHWPAPASPAMSYSSPRNCGTTIKNVPAKRCRRAWRNSSSISSISI